uniref:Uncharacterized protein n=1 Tax=Arundo donax TaxID=35708 RepID=A0A0A8XZ23_ARUDO
MKNLAAPLLVSLSMLEMLNHQNFVVTSDHVGNYYVIVESILMLHSLDIEFIILMKSSLALPESPLLHR